MCWAIVPLVFPLRRPSARSPAALAPFLQMRTLFTQGGVVAVPRIHDSVVVVHAEQLAADIPQQLLERSRLPGLADPAGEQTVS